MEPLPPEKAVSNRKKGLGEQKLVRIDKVTPKPKRCTKPATVASKTVRITAPQMGHFSKPLLPALHRPEGDEPFTAVPTASSKPNLKHDSVSIHAVASPKNNATHVTDTSINPSPESDDSSAFTASQQSLMHRSIRSNAASPSPSLCTDKARLPTSASESDPQVSTQSRTRNSQASSNIDSSLLKRRFEASQTMIGPEDYLEQPLTRYQARRAGAEKPSEAQSSSSAQATLPAQVKSSAPSIPPAKASSDRASGRKRRPAPTKATQSSQKPRSKRSVKPRPPRKTKAPALLPRDLDVEQHRNDTVESATKPPDLPTADLTLLYNPFSSPRTRGLSVDSQTTVDDPFDDPMTPTRPIRAHCAGFVAGEFVGIRCTERLSLLHEPEDFIPKYHWMVTPGSGIDEWKSYQVALRYRFTEEQMRRAAAGERDALQFDIDVWRSTARKLPRHVHKHDFWGKLACKHVAGRMEPGLGRYFYFAVRMMLEDDGMLVFHTPSMGRHAYLKVPFVIGE